MVSASTQGQTFTKIQATSSNDVWAIGYRHGLSAPLVHVGAPLLFHWNGSQWSSLSPPIPGTPSIFADIAALGPNDVWVLGYHTPTPGVATPFMIHWNGSSWATVPAPPGGGSLKAFAPNDIYAGGGSVWHFDGNGWSTVQTFPTLTSASFAAIDGVAPCQLWGAGGQWVIGQAVPFVARQDSVYWDKKLRAGCLPGSTPGSIAASFPRLGSILSVDLSDPMLALPMPAGALGLSYWVVSAAPVSTSGCGIPIVGAGAGGGLGELLVDLGSILLASGPQIWNGGSSVSGHAAFIPAVPQLAGVQVFSQGALVDVSTSHMILTPALDLRVGY